MYKQITSVQNPLIKEVIQLQKKSRIRKKKELFIIEGLREISLALKGHYHINIILFCEDIISIDEINNSLELSNQVVELITISREVYQKISHRKTTEGIIAITKSKSLSIKDLKLCKNPLILIAEAPEKPGNIGALLRTSDAANLDAVIIANPKTDLYNPNIIRSSVGCVFTNQIAMGATNDVINYLKENDIQILSAALVENSKDYTLQDFTISTAIVVGTEDSGLSKEWLQNSTKNIIIPMEGEIDSLNVSVSAAILIFEAKRQRRRK